MLEKSGKEVRQREGERRIKTAKLPIVHRKQDVVMFI